MTVDTTKIKPGDTVSLVTLRVKEISKGGAYVHVWLDDISSFPMRPDQIAAHHPAPRQIKVDDRVKSTVLGVTGTVKGVDGDTIWVRRDDDEYVNYPVSYLVIIEGDINNEIEISPEAANGGWITWNGGECPVDHRELVECRFRDGRMKRYSAGGFDWHYYDRGMDIIAYRLHNYRGKN